MHDVDNAVFEGLFVRSLELTPALREALSAAGYDHQRPKAGYPSAVFVACLEATQRVLLPELERDAALRELGRRLIAGFQQTILGRVATTALPLLGPARFVQKLPGRFQSIRRDATATAEVVSERAARLVFADPAPLGPFFAGVVESALRLSGAKDPQVVLAPTPTGYTLSLSW